MHKFADGHQNKAPTSGNDNLRSSPKPCCDVCSYCRPLADSEGHISSNHFYSSKCPQAILNSLVVTEENGINQFSGLQKTASFPVMTFCTSVHSRFYNLLTTILSFHNFFSVPRKQPLEYPFAS